MKQSLPFGSRSIALSLTVLITSGLTAGLGCSGTPDGESASPDGGATGPGPGATVVVPPSAETTPPGTTSLPLTSAPALGEVKALRNRSSVTVFLPAVAGTRDYRVFAVRNTVVASTVGGNREHIAGAAIHCAGLRQRNQCDASAIASVHFNNDGLDLPTCKHSPSVPVEVNRAVEINDIGADETLVIEAIDRRCPFPGVLGRAHADVSTATAEMGATADVVVNNQAFTIKRWQDSFPVRTESEIAAQYGSVYFNGQEPDRPNFTTSPPESPLIRMAQPAPADDPVVVARAVVKVSALGTQTLPAGFGSADYFDDFSSSSDQPVFAANTGNLPSAWENAAMPWRIDRWENSKWNFYMTGMEAPPENGAPAHSLAQMFIDRGVLHTVLSDYYLDAMSSLTMYPKRAVNLPTAADQYLHVTYEVPTIESSRRYINLALCGADSPGQTYASGRPLTAPVPRPAFMNDEDISRTNPLGWNCLYLVPRGPGYDGVAGGDQPGLHSDTSIKVTVMPTHAAPKTADQYQTTSPPNGLAKQFGPNQEAPFPRQWDRQIDATKQPSGPWLDDVMDVWRRTKFDVFIRRDRVVIFVNGEQRLCSDLSALPLTMAEGALGFWQVLYHSSAEFSEMRQPFDWANVLTGSSHVLNNIPFIDDRVWDNVGFRENVTLPGVFDAARCL
jgi:hypothetical protein